VEVVVTLDSKVVDLQKKITVHIMNNFGNEHSTNLKKLNNAENVQESKKRQLNHQSQSYLRLVRTAITFIIILLGLPLVFLNKSVAQTSNQDIKWPPETECPKYNTQCNLLGATNDMTGAELSAAIKARRADSPLINLGPAFVAIGKELNINPIYIAAHAAQESAWGTSRLAKNKNNLFGWGAYDKAPYDSALTFRTKEEGIKYAMGKIKSLYLTQGGKHYYGANLAGMNVRYSTDKCTTTKKQCWATKIADIMNTLILPPPPSALSITAPSTSQIQVKWQDNSRNETGFEILWLARSNSYTTLDIVPANTTSYTRENLPPGTMMCFRVRAISKAGKGYQSLNKFAGLAAGQKTNCAKTPRK
jgi:flagellum-specific peptidoglycan hydrolase FlgJ